MKYNFFTFLFMDDKGKKRWFSVAIFLICSFFYTMLFITNTWQDFFETGWIVFLMNTGVLLGYTTDNYLTYKKGK